MPSSGFFDTNLRRTYPFVYGQDNNLPDCAIVDFGSTMLGGSGFVPGTHKVWLEWIRLVGNVVEYSFRTDAPGLLDSALIFQRSIEDPDFVTQFTWAQTALSVEEVEAPCDCDDNLVLNWDFDEAGVDVPEWTVSGTGAAVQAADILEITLADGEDILVEQTISGLVGDAKAKVFINVPELTTFEGSPLILRIRDVSDAVLGQLEILETGSYSLTVTTNSSQFKIQLVMANDGNPSVSADVDFVTAHNCVADNQSYSRLPPSDEICRDEPFWEGFLVTGNMQCILDYLEACAQDGDDPDVVTYTYLEGPVYVEPTTTQSLASHFVRSFAIANAERTRATRADGCRDLCWPFEQQDHYVMCECVSGNVRFSSGYNFNVRQETTDNALVFDAEVGSGLGEPCSEVQLAISEAAPAGRKTLSGSLTCDEVVRSINGVSNQVFLIEARTGVRVTSIPDQHRVIVDVDLNTLALCPDLGDPEPVTCLPPSVDPCECGPSDPDDFECPEGAVTQPLPTTTPAPGAGGPCSWIVVDGVWVLNTGACGDGYYCPPPIIAAAPEGATTSTGCISEPDNVPPGICPLVDDPEFLFEPAFKGWDIVANAVRLNSYPGIPSSEFPMALLQAVEGADAILSQAITLTTPGLYRIVADVMVLQGRSEISVIDGAGSVVAGGITLATFPGEYRMVVSSTFFIDAPDVVLFRIRSFEALSMNGRGAVLIGRPCLQLVE